ncbi:MAG: imidazole glycerol phosphate synthase subunit HisH [Lachnospiraceae bacterium]|nr:imidazole glycerol phosphate synthase subunit HisH [Lachnospiraceae bacterium]
MKSVEKALQFLGEDVTVTRDLCKLLEADRVVLPGVGAFGAAMERLEGYGLTEVIHRITDRGTPFLGICLGLQLLFEESEDEILKVPQIGWNDLRFPKESRLFKGVPEGSFVYFVHSYYLSAADFKDVAATTEYGVTVHAAVEHDNVFACQFHPEKSDRVGLQILRNFISFT